MGQRAAFHSQGMVRKRQAQAFIPWLPHAATHWAKPVGWFSCLLSLLVSHKASHRGLQLQQVRIFRIIQSEFHNFVWEGGNLNISLKLLAWLNIDARAAGCVHSTTGSIRRESTGSVTRWPPTLRGKSAPGSSLPSSASASPLPKLSWCSQTSSATPSASRYPSSTRAQ